MNGIEGFANRKSSVVNLGDGIGDCDATERLAIANTKERDFRDISREAISSQCCFIDCAIVGSQKSESDSNFLIFDAR